MKPAAPLTINTTGRTRTRSLKRARVDDVDVEAKEDTGTSPVLTQPGAATSSPTPQLSTTVTLVPSTAPLNDQLRVFMWVACAWKIQEVKPMTFPELHTLCREVEVSDDAPKLDVAHLTVPPLPASPANVICYHLRRCVSMANIVNIRAVSNPLQDVMYAARKKWFGTCCKKMVVHRGFDPRTYRL